MIKGSVQEEDTTIVNIYAPNIGAPQYIRQTLTDIEGEIDTNTIVGDFNTSMDRSSKQKINKETQVLNDTLDEMDLIDIFRTLHPNAEEYTFFSSVHRTFSQIDHMLGHKSDLSKFKKFEIVSSIFSNNSAMRLRISYKKKLRNTNTWRLNSTFLNNQQITEDIEREVNKFAETKQWEHDNSKPMGWSKSSSKREVYSNTVLPQETRKTSNRQPNFTPKITGKRQTRNTELVDGNKS